MPVATKRWTEIRASGPEAGKDRAIACLIGAGSGAVIESSRSAGSPLAFTGEQALTACLPEGAERALASLADGLKAIGWSAAIKTIKDRDWSVLWRAGIKPVRVSCSGSRGKDARGLFIKTSWSKALKRPGETEIIIDPSMAFGTGSHPTTRMCLKALATLLGGPSVASAKGPILDVGTGSAILMIAAMRLGATRALGLEIDPLAIRVARKNLKRNNIRARLSSSPLSNVREKFSIITANIFSEELRRLAPGLVDRLGSAQGYIVLSGLLREQAPPIISLYRGLGMRVFKRFVSREWTCIVLVRGKDMGGKGGS